MSEQSLQKNEKKCQFLKSLGRAYLSGQSLKKKRRKSVNYGKVWEGVICRNSPTPKKKGEKVLILEKFRKRLFVGTVTPKKREKKGQLSKKIRKRLFIGTVPPKKRRKSVNS